MQRASSGLLLGATFGEDYDPILNAPQFRYLLALSGHVGAQDTSPLCTQKRTNLVVAILTKR